MILDKRDIINMLKGQGPGSYDEMCILASKQFGSLGPGDQWIWNTMKLDETPDEELLEVYSTLKGRLK